MLPRISISKDTLVSIALMVGALAVVIGLSIFFGHTKSRPAAAPRDVIKAADEHSAAARNDSLIVEPDAGMEPVLSAIRAATSSVDAVMYEINDQDIEQALADAQTRGVAVRVLLNHGYLGKPSIKNASAYAYFTSHHVPVRWTSSSFALTHQKTLLVDKKVALILTFNFVPKYYKTSRDFGVVDPDAADVSAIASTFAADWTDTAKTDDPGDDLVWSPNSKDALLSFIGTAKKTLEVYNEEMADQDIIQALMAASQRGAAVEIIMAYSSKWKDAFSELSNAGVQIHVYKRKRPLYIHAKAMVADNTYVFVGSENFSSNSLLKNRELGLIISSPILAHSLLATFKTDWANALPYSSP
jgi:cardiolipin synthase